MAVTYEKIAQDHNAFYEGTLAQDIVDDIKEYGKLILVIKLHNYSLLFTDKLGAIKLAFKLLLLLLLFYNKDPEEILLFNSVGYSLQQGYEAQRHVKAFEQIGSAPIPTAGHTT